MTPEEKARLVIYQQASMDDLVAVVAKAIRDAVAERSEACAKVVEKRWWIGCDVDAIDKIAEEIRNLK